MDQEKFGKLIKEIRKKNNLTQKQFADKYNVTYQAVSKWENGKNLPDITLIKQIANDYNISVDNLIQVNHSKKKLLTLIIAALIIIIIVFIFCIIVPIFVEHFNKKVCKFMHTFFYHKLTIMYSYFFIL